jgi:(E)-4-hydroxy-3-methylbut-2-enyl-diphosphate synthase
LSEPYLEDPYFPRRRCTREVAVGDVRLGGDQPLRIQSMTTTDTRDVRATADQAERLVDAGCEIVRITAPSITDAEALAGIRAELDRRRVRAPLVADIHFTPNAALVAAEHVEKVRVNPGNYADKKRFEVREYSDAQYGDELERVAARFRPLVLRCRELGRVLRIGTNHGSLSDRVLNRYGDTPLGMVESALEFLDVCEDEGFRDVVFSMKASNAQVAIQAYRLLAARLARRAGGFTAPSYPFHLGVTEAGDGDDARVKSAIGIGALLEDGIGDTIRVSLTEDPVREIPVARELAAPYDARWAKPLPVAAPLALAAFPVDPYAHVRRVTSAQGAGEFAAGGANPVRVELELGPPPADAGATAARLLAALGKAPELACEGLVIDLRSAAELDAARVFAATGLPAPLTVRVPAALAPAAVGIGSRCIVMVDGQGEALAPAARAARAAGVGLEWSLALEGAELPAAVERALEASGELGELAFSASGTGSAAATRLLAGALESQSRGEVAIALRHRADPFTPGQVALLRAATELGAPLCDGIGDRISVGGFGGADRDLRVAYRILQGARLRTSWTEFISCPSCGRTLFDLEETTARVKEKTQHLRGLKIAVMGCIVNGPGEMADADFGYVGSGPGKVNLYVGHECVVRNVPEGEAPGRLVELIQDRGQWSDPPAS